MDECGEKRYKPFMGKAGNPDFRRGGHPVCERCPHDMTMMLETIRGAGARPERISRQMDLPVEGRPTVLPGCESPWSWYGSLPDIRSGVCFRPGKRDTPSRRKCSNGPDYL